MFSKVLVAEDVDSINMGILQLLKDSFDVEADHVKYCDDALLKIRRAEADGNPFDLLITDLSFKEDHRQALIVSGEDLVAQARALQPELKVIMYSVEDRPHRIQSFFNQLKINGYICKGRQSSRDFLKAIPLIFEGKSFISEEIQSILSNHQQTEIDELDLEILSQLSFGLSQEEIAEHLKNQGKKPNSLSSVEKRVNKLKIHFQAKNAVHLIALAKDLGIV